MSGVTIRAMKPEDWDRVAAIYEEGIATGQATFETEVPSPDEWDRKHHEHSRFVAEREGLVVGWGALSPVSPRRAYAGVAEVSVYVAPNAARTGIGSMLMEKLIESARREGIWTLQSSTFPENAASIRLQEAHGFRLVGRRERIAMHHGLWRDTVLLELRL